MAMTTDSLLLDISVNSKSASASIDALVKKFSSLEKTLTSVDGSTKKTSDSVSGMGATVVKLSSFLNVAQVAWNAFGGAAKHAFAEFSEGEQANTKLINSLVATGQYTRQSFDRFNELAESISGVSKASDEQVKALASYSLNLGNTADRTEQMIQAAQGLSVGLGIGLEEAFGKLQVTLSGSTGSLGKTVKGFKSLTEEQLKAGVGIEVIAAQFKDFQDKGLQGADGALTKMMKAFNDLFEEMGKAINTGAGFESTFGTITKMIRQATDHLVTHKREWGILVEIIGKSVSLIVDSVKVVVNSMKSGFSLIGQIITKPFSKNYSEAFAQEWQKATDDATANFVSIGQTVSSFGELGKTSVKGIADELAKADEQAKKFKPTLASVIPLEPTKAYLDLLSKINEENATLMGQITGIGKTEYEQQQAAATALVNKIGLKIQELSLNRDLTASERERLSEQYVQQANLVLQQTSLQQLNDIQEQTKGILSDIESSRMNEFEIIAKSLSLELQKVDAIAAQVDGSTESGKAMLAALEAQKSALKEKSSLAIDLEFDKSMEKFGTFAQAIGYATKGVGEGLNSGIGFLNKSFGTNIGLFKEESIAAAGVMGAKIGQYITDGAVAFAKAASAVFNTFMKFLDPEFYKGITDSIGKILNNFPNILQGAMDGLMGALDGLLENGPAILDNVLVKVETFFSGLIAKLPQIFSQLGDAFGKIIESIARILPQMIDGLFAALPDLIDKIADAFGTLIDALPGIFQKIFDGLPDLVDKLLSKLPDLITKILNAIPQIIQGFVRMIPKLIDAIAKNIGPILEALISGLLGAIGEIIAVISDPVTITKIVVSIIKAIVAAVIGIIKGIISGIGKFFKGLFGGAKFDGFKSAGKSVANDISSSFKKAAKSFTKEGSSLFAVTGFGDGAGKKQKDEIQSLGDSILDQFEMAGEKIKGIWDWIKEGWNWVVEKLTQLFTWVWDKIFKPIIDGITAVFQWVWDNIFKPIIDAFTVVFQWVWDKIFSPIIEGFTTVFTWIKEKIFDPIGETISGAFTGIMDTVGKIGEGIAGPIKDAFSGVSDIFKNLFGGVKALFKGDWSGFTDSIKTGFKDAGDLIMKPIKAIFNAFIDIINMMKIPGVSVDFEILKKRVKFDLWGDIDLIPGDIARFARGGLVAAAAGGAIPGFGTDTVPAMLTPGEFVMRREAVQSAGLGAMNAINSGSIPSTQNQTFNFDVAINVQASSQSLDEGYVRQRLIPAMKAELKRASYAGELLISNRGIDK